MSVTDPNSAAGGYSRDNLKYVVITATCFVCVLSTSSVGLRPNIKENQWQSPLFG